jgi:O-antigen/teichoic acid export membrane protein
MLRILIRNIISNWLGFGVQVAVAFFLTPFVLHTLGDTRYGIWALVIGLTGYYGLLDLGFRSGITQYLTRHLATRDFVQMNRTASTAFVTLASCGWLVTIASLLLAWLAPHIFNIPQDAIDETRLCIVVIGVSTALQFAFFPFSAVFAATQRYDVSNVIGISTRLLVAAGTFFALSWRYGLVGLCAVNAAGDLLGYMLRWRVAHWILPELHISLRLASRQHFWPITQYGIWSILSQSAVQLKSYSSSLIIGLFLPMAAIAPFALATGLINQFEGIFRPIATVFFPAATHLDAQGDLAGLRRMYLAGSKFLLLLAFACGTIGAVWADDFYRLWVGPRLVKGGAYPSVAVLFEILLVATIFAIAQKIGLQVFMASRKMREMTILLACEAAANLLLTVCLIVPFGLIGVALGTLIPTAVCQGLFQPAVLCRLLGIPATAYLRQVYVRPLVVSTLLCLLLSLLHGVMPFCGSWRMLAINGLIAGAITLPAVVMIGLDRAERQRLVLNPLARFGRRLWFGKPIDVPLDTP